MVERKQLSESLEPAELVPGSRAVLVELVETFQGSAAQATQIASALSRLVVPGWSGDAADAFSATLRVEASAWSTASAGLSAMSSAAAEYLAVFDSSRTKASVAAEQYEAALTARVRARAAWELDGRVGAFVDPTAGARATAEAAVESAWRQLQEAGDAAANAFGRVEKPNVNTGWGVLAIGSMTSAQVQRYARTHPDLAANLAALGPEAVKAWWGSLSTGERERLEKSIPGVIGNLEGVDYDDRSTANRAELAAAEARLRRVKKDDPGYAAARTKLAAIHAIQKTLTTHPEKLSPPLQLLSLDLSGDTPKAAISVGDMDIADHITYNIPGIQTTVAKDMKAWTNVSRNLYRKQQKFGRDERPSPGLAVVAYLGFETPQQQGWNPAEALLDENGNDLAVKGGGELATALNGTLATKGWGRQSTNLSVVGFSYGATTATEALKKASAGSLVLVGSAGVVPVAVGRTVVAPRVNVPEGRISAGQATADTTASWGRSLSGRWDPSSLGAKPFSADDAHTPDGQPTAGTTAHASTVHSSDPENYGYYDIGTTALNNIAAASMDYPDQMAK